MIELGPTVCSDESVTNQPSEEGSPSYGQKCPRHENDLVRLNKVTGWLLKKCTSQHISNVSGGKTNNLTEMPTTP